MTQKEAYMEGMRFAMTAWDEPETQAMQLPDEAMQREYNKGYANATVMLLCGKMDLNAALHNPLYLKRPSGPASETPKEG